MKTLLTAVRKKINHLILSLVLTGSFLVIMAILIVWTDFILELLVGLIVLAMAYIMFYGAYRIWSIKKELERFFKL